MTERRSRLVEDRGHRVGSRRRQQLGLLYELVMHALGLVHHLAECDAVLLEVSDQRVDLVRRLDLVCTVHKIISRDKCTVST